MRRSTLTLFAGLVLGMVIGLFLARTSTFVEIATILVEAFVGVLNRHGLPVALAAAGFIFLAWMVWRCMTWVIEGRDGEIERLVEDKKWWQERFAGTAPSSKADARSRGDVTDESSGTVATDRG